jgi:uncharacterized protein DUF6062
MSEAKFIGYLRLVEACRTPGCPVCRCVIDESRHYLAALLYEQVTDPDTRGALRASWGFCGWHAGMLPEIEQSIFGAAIIYDDLVRLALERTEALAGGARPPRRRGWLAVLGGRPRPGDVVARYRARPACPACVSVGETERRALDTLVRLFDDGDLQAAYARSDGLCVPHLFAAVEVGDGRAEVATLVGRTREKWRTLGRTLGSFVAKHDYRNREPYTPAEAAASARAFDTLAGTRGVFGNDVRGAR